VEPHILIVDDEVDLLETLVRLLGRLGYKCRVASSAADAILALDAETPDLVVTDLHMPGTDGWAVVRHARRRAPPIPVIVLTAYATSETHQEIRRMGSTTYIAKPFANADLVNAVQRAVAQLALDRESATPRRPPEEQP
jgi:CheY-like chemotaxis protein